MVYILFKTLSFQVSQDYLSVFTYYKLYFIGITTCLILRLNNRGNFGLQFRSRVCFLECNTSVGHSVRLNIKTAIQQGTQAPVLKNILRLCCLSIHPVQRTVFVFNYNNIHLACLTCIVLTDNREQQEEAHSLNEGRDPIHNP